MTKRKVMVELVASKKLSHQFTSTFNVADSKLKSSDIPDLPGIKLDSDFPALALPTIFQTPTDYSDGHAREENLYDTSFDFSFDDSPDNSTYLVRGEIEDDKITSLENFIKKDKNYVGVYADVSVQSTANCNGAPVGTDKDVERILRTDLFKNCDMTGQGVKVAIVDTGINMDHLRGKGKNPVFDGTNSWKPASSPHVPGNGPVGHGTMVAFDVCIAAPECTILDIALLQSNRGGSTAMEGFLSDAVIAYRHLLNVIQRDGRPGENTSLVVNNSWGMYHPSWDFPVGHPGNFSDNPNHPFNRIVQTLEKAGADILFAAGNCGQDCPDRRCQGVATKAIYGANSSPYVTCVAGIDVNKQRMGYSSIGPGRLVAKKPDISGYTHFRGSGVYSADGGTSAACPVVAGVVAAIRNKIPLSNDSQTRPSAIRNLITSTAEDLGPTGYDYIHGFGVIDGRKLVTKICRTKPSRNDFGRSHRIKELLDRYKRIFPIRDIYSRYPELFQRIHTVDASIKWLGLGDDPISSQEVESFSDEELMLLQTLVGLLEPPSYCKKKCECHSEDDQVTIGFLSK